MNRWTPSSRAYPRQARWDGGPLTVGDLVMWDNYATVHRGAGGYSAEERRLMHRTTLKGQQRRPAAA